MDDKLYLFAPQWQDSGYTKELFFGALRLKQYFEAICNFPISEITIDTEDRPVLQNNIVGFDVIEKQLSAIHSKLVKSNAKKLGLIGGGCGIEIPVVSYLLGKNPNLQVIWFDAHGDLNTADSSSSKFFHGMPLRYILEEQNDEIGRPYKKLDSSNLCLVGSRDLDPSEIEYVRANKLKLIPISANYWTDIKLLFKTNVPTYIHLDLDVLDPDEYGMVMCPIPKGLSISELEKTIDHIAQSTDLVGMSIVENTEVEEEKIKKLKGIFNRFLEL